MTRNGVTGDLPPLLRDDLTADTAREPERHLESLELGGATNIVVPFTLQS